ncbi:hypothetical protein K2I41_21435 [Xanthomonas oryzae pv. oryzicola]|nr:hypothetical protein K2I41_21435 [Xanthomonas oryzae pv. oryzicola]
MLEPASPAGASGLFALLPVAASNRLPSRHMVRVAGHFAGHPLQPSCSRMGRVWALAQARQRLAAGRRCVCWPDGGAGNRAGCGSARASGAG